MNKKTTAALALLLLASCAQGTGILPAGPDTYTVTEHRAPILGGVITAQQVTMTEANDFCENQGKKLLPLNTNESGIGASQATWGNTTFSMTFRCLEPGDRELKRPNFQPAPNIVIEQRNR
jgi:hypothetical protein